MPPSNAEKYTQRIRYAIRGLWSGAIDRDQFESNMTVIVNDLAAAAFAEGAKENGLAPEDYTDKEQQAINDWADSEAEHIGDLAEFVATHSKAEGGTLEMVQTRGELWALRYPDIVNRAKVLTGKDRKYRWDLGDTEHCTTCSNLAGQIRRGSFWQAHVLPQNPPNPKLECKGYRCQCKLVETMLEPTTRGRLPGGL